MWLGWQRLTRNNIYNFQCVVIYWVECAWEFYILCKLYIWELQCISNSVFRPTHKPTDYSRSNQAQCSVNVTPATGTWTQLNIFIDLLCPAVFSWLLTADLLWCWRLTRPPLCRICAGVDRSGAADMKKKHVGSFGSSGWLNYRHCRLLWHSKLSKQIRSQFWSSIFYASDTVKNKWFRCAYSIHSFIQYSVWRQVQSLL
jgi:hypothetical protein